MLRPSLRPNNDILNFLIVLLVLSFLIAWLLHTIFPTFAADYWQTLSLTMNVLFVCWFLMLALVKFERK